MKPVPEYPVIEFICTGPTAMASSASYVVHVRSVGTVCRNTSLLQQSASLISWHATGTVYGSSVCVTSVAKEAATSAATARSLLASTGT